MNDQAIDLTVCDREPIHIPGSIQPHGLMLVVDPAGLTVTHAAGAVEARLGRGDWFGASLGDLLVRWLQPQPDRCSQPGNPAFSIGWRCPAQATCSTPASTFPASA